MITMFEDSLFSHYPPRELSLKGALDKLATGLVAGMELVNADAQSFMIKSACFSKHFAGPEDEIAILKRLVDHYQGELGGVFSRERFSHKVCYVNLQGRVTDPTGFVRCLTLSWTEFHALVDLFREFGHGMTLDAFLNQL